MCGCKFSVGAKGNLSQPVILSASDVANYRTKDILICIYSASPEKFKAAYNGVIYNGSALSDDITSQKDVEDLAALHDSGDDVKLYKVDFLKIAQGIKHTDEELKQASCTIGLTQ